MGDLGLCSYTTTTTTTAALASSSSSAYTMALKTPPPNRPRFSAFARLDNHLEVAMAEKLAREEELNSFLLSRATAVNQALKDHSLIPPDSSLARPGKRIRPALCLAACELVGGSSESALPAACAVEIIHQISILGGMSSNSDGAPRGQLHGQDNDRGQSGEQLCDQARSYGQGCRSAALGPALYNIVSATKGVAPEKLTRVIVELCRASGADGLVSGTFMDSATCVDVHRLHYVHLRKTAALLESSVASGAILGGGSDAAVERLRRYARYISLLFSVVVDILDHHHHYGPHHDSHDLAADKRRATYTDLLGIEASEVLAHQLHQEAKLQLDMFDAFKASPLRKLADYLLQLIQ